MVGIVDRCEHGGARDRCSMFALTMVKTIVTGNTKKDHSDRPTVVLSEIERDVRIDRMKRVSCENTSGIWPRN